jgi:hypothetical protein
MINKLLIVRTANSRSSLIEEAGLAPFLKGQVINISPKDWEDESGLSHYGYVLNGLKLKDLDALTLWVGQADGVTLLPLNLDSDYVAALQAAGLRINESA